MRWPLARGAGRDALTLGRPAEAAPFAEHVLPRNRAPVLMDVQPAGGPSQQDWAAVRQGLTEIKCPTRLDPRQLRERLSIGERPPIRMLLGRLAHSGLLPVLLKPP